MRDIRPQKDKKEPPMPESTPPPKPRFIGSSVPVSNINVPAEPPAASAPEPLSPPRPLKKKAKPRVGHREKMVVLALLCLVGLAAVLASVIFLPRAEIGLVLRTAPLLVDERFVLTTDNTSAPNTIPGTAYWREVQVEGTEPVTSTEMVGTKASGTVSLVNRTVTDQSIQDQSRLVTSDGQLFYLQRGVTIPAASGGTPSRINAPIEAAEAGEEGNISAQRLDFAGLDENSQQLVYAETTNALTGGTGEVLSVIEESDLEAAREAAGKIAREQVEQDIKDELPSGWAILDESWAAEFSEFDQPHSIGDRETEIPFSARVVIRVMAYEIEAMETHLKTALESRMDAEYMLFPGPISYNKTIEDTDWETAEATLSVRVTHTTVARLALPTLREKLTGRNTDEARSYLEGLPGVRSASIELSPFWANSIPRIENRVTIDLSPERQP